MMVMLSVEECDIGFNSSMMGGFPGEMLVHHDYIKIKEK